MNAINNKPDRTNPSSIQSHLATTNPVSTLADEITLPYNFTLSATAPANLPGPTLFWSVKSRDMYRQGRLGDPVKFSLRNGNLVYDNFEVGFGPYVTVPAESMLERPGRGWDFYVQSGMQLRLIAQGRFVCASFQKGKLITHDRKYERY